ncbi:MAG: peptidyl-tRNA hydrolase, partial [Planctomycetota bacterium]
QVERAWLTGSFAKVCCRVDDGEELVAIHEKATEAGLQVHRITDSNKSEFHGERTRTCLAIGPDEAAKLDEIMGESPLS